MRLTDRLALLAALVGCTSKLPGQTNGPSIERIEVLLRADSAGNRMVVAERLKLPSQRPWQNGFYVALYLGPTDAVVLRSENLSVAFDLKMGPQMYGGPDGELLLTTKIDQDGVWFRADTTATREESCAQTCPQRVLFGPFELSELIPGPRDGDALLWPTRLRIYAQVLGVARSGKLRSAVPSSVSRAVAFQELGIN
jgi:hypothetical protein